MTEENHDNRRSRPDDPARLRAQAEQRFVIRCVRCNREIARSAAENAGWRDLPSGPTCPECAEHDERESALVASCSSCDTKIAASAALDFGWGYWPDESGEQRLYCPACAIDRLEPR